MLNIGHINYEFHLMTRDGLRNSLDERASDADMHCVVMQSTILIDATTNIICCILDIDKVTCLNFTKINR